MSPPDGRYVALVTSGDPYSARQTGFDVLDTANWKWLRLEGENTVSTSTATGVPVWTNVSGNFFGFWNSHVIKVSGPSGNELWDVSTGKRIALPHQFAEVLDSLDLDTERASSDGQVIAGYEHAAGPASLVACSFSTGNIYVKLPAYSWDKFHLSEDGQRLIVVKDRSVDLYNVNTGALVQSLTPQSPVVRFIKGTDYFINQDDRGTFVVRNNSTGATVCNFSDPGGALLGSVGLSAAVALLNSAAGTVDIWKVGS
jgi:hypothetical protein